MISRHSDGDTVIASSLGSVSVWLLELTDTKDSAREKIYLRYKPLVLKLASRSIEHFGVRGIEAEDIAHDVFETFFRKTSNGQMSYLLNRRQLQGMLARICRQRALDVNRKNRRLKTESAMGVDDEGNMIGLVAVPDRELDDCLRVVETAILLEHLSTCGEGLSEIARLRIDGLSVRKIAELTQNTKRTVERRLQIIKLACLSFLDK